MARQFDRALAEYQTAHIENALIDGFPPPGAGNLGPQSRTAVFEAAQRTGASYDALRRRVGVPGQPGYFASLNFLVDWGLYHPPDEQADVAAAVAAYKRHNNYRRAGEELGIPPSTVQSRVQQAARRGAMGYKPTLPGFRVSRTSTQYDGEGNVRGESVEQKPDIGDVFEMPAGQMLKGVSALVDPDGNVIQQWIKTRSDTVTPLLVEAFKAEFADYRGKSDLIVPPARTDEDLLSVYPVADHHHGMLSWGKETGEDYDLEVSAERLLSSATRLIAQAPSARQAILLDLGDWQHTDDQSNVTPRSKHQLDVDSRFPKILRTGVKLKRHVVDLLLQKHEKVLVRNIPGNHDPNAAVAMTIALASFYENNPRVTVEEDPSAFFFHRFGACLIGATHGHNVTKPKDMAMVMADRCRKDWGATNFHYFYFGHIHHKTADEVAGVIVESFQTLAAKDAHAHSRGYSSGQSMVSITLHRECGEVGRHQVNLRPVLTKPSRF